MGGRAGRAENGVRERIAGPPGERFREQFRGDGKFGTAVGKLGDDTKFVIRSRSGRRGRMVLLVRTSVSGRMCVGRTAGLFSSVQQSVKLRARGENRQQQHQSGARQRGDARAEREL